MAFIISSTDTSLDRSVLWAMCRRHDDSWIRSSIDLNNYLANIDGKFQVGSANFYATASQVKLEGSVLHANLLRADLSTSTPDNINLNTYIVNDDGSLRFKTTSNSNPEGNTFITGNNTQAIDDAKEDTHSDSNSKLAYLLERVIEMDARLERIELLLVRATTTEYPTKLSDETSSRTD